MKLKCDRSRIIHVPTLLMGDLWEYSIFERPKRENRSKILHKELFLTELGKPYSESAIGRIFSKISGTVGFQVTPHMLRHSYATHTLHKMREMKSKIDPLLYIRDRLGHSSVTTTERYLHFLNSIEDDLINDYQTEIDGLFVKA